MMPAIVGVRFQPAGKLYYFDPGGLSLEPPAMVIVPSPQGDTVATVSLGTRDVIDTGKEPLKAIVRAATADDRARWAAVTAAGDDLAAHAARIVEDLGLAIKVVSAEQSFDQSRVTINYSSPEPVGTGELGSRLAAVAGMRVEARHVGDRDMARLTGDLGLCGRTLCCRSWLTEFPPVSIKMAKNQDLPLNPQKISGACGRLLCCLAYENDFYSDVRRTAPKTGSRVETPQGPGQARLPYVLRESVGVLLDDGEFVELPLADVTPARGSPVAAPPAQDDLP